MPRGTGILACVIMPVTEFSGLIFHISGIAGFLGALTGLGGGGVVTPVLTLLFGVDIRYAIGATLIPVIATSSGAAAAYVREGFSNIRIGMFLEIATTAGALLGAWLNTRVRSSALAIIFGLVLLYSAWLTARGRNDLRSIARTTTGAVKLRPREFIQFGLVLLLFTPVARVAFSVFAFAAERNRTYVIVTLIVLGILISSIVGHI